MTIYFFWGEDDFAIAKTVEKLRQEILDPNWLQFNYDKLSGEQMDTLREGLTQAITPVFGMGGRLVWLTNATICQHCSEDLLSQLEGTFTSLPETTTLLFTSSQKPDGRLKSTKLVQKYAEIREFSLIPPWRTELIAKQVEDIAQQLQVKLTSRAVELLAESVGNNTRQLWSELEKLKLYHHNQSQILDIDIVANLVYANNQNTLQLANAIRQGDQSLALGLVSELIQRNEPALKIVATLTGQFRTWTMVKLMLESGEKDEKAIATAAEISNPKRIYFLRQEINNLSSKGLLCALSILLELEFSLKRGADPVATLQQKVIELCRCCQIKA
jgi:DNA polymerase III subunit delta